MMYYIEQFVRNSIIGASGVLKLLSYIMLHNLNSIAKRPPK
ncbi:hypothetical protein [Weissella coleopterorum]|nr:hypothetical protein [Weissella coleopterorum]